MSGLVAMLPPTQSDAGVSVRIPPDPVSVREALDGILSSALVSALDDDNTDRLELILAEALNNVLEHALGPDHPDSVQLVLWREGAAICCRIIDTGRPLPGLRLPAGRQPNVNGPVPTLPEGGFGWFLIRTLASDVLYRRHGGENHLTLRLSIESERPN